MELFKRLNKNRVYILSQVLLLFLLLNYLFSNLNCRKDMSRFNRFELTRSTESILKNLPEKLYINAYFSSDIPSEYKPRINLVKEIIKEIADVNRKKVALRFYDPDSGEEDRKKAKEAGIRPLTIQKIERGSAQLKNDSFFGLTLTVGSKTETLPVVPEAEKVEYQILSTLKKMFRKTNNSAVAIIKAPGAMTSPPIQQGAINKDTFSLFFQRAYEPENGKVTEVKINEDVVPEEITTLILSGDPGLSEEGKFAIDQFLLRGGNLIIFPKMMDFTLEDRQNPYAAMMQRQQPGLARTSPEAAKLNTFFEKYGFKINTDMVMEPENSMPLGPLVQVEPGVIGRYHYPLWLIVDNNEGINSEHILTKETKGLLVPWTSTIEKFETKQKGMKFTSLMESTVKADIRKDFVMVGEKQVFSQEIKPKGTKFTLSLLLEGELQSSFTKDSIPTKYKDNSFLEKTPTGKKTKILVFGSPYIISDVLAMNRETAEVFSDNNVPFFLNVIDVLSGDTDLLAARTKQSGILKLKPFPKNVEILFSILNVFLVPIILSVYAFFRIKKRNRSV